MSEASFTVEQWEVARIKPYPRNARVIPNAAVETVATSIKEYGWQQPIVVDEQGIILAGHARLLAAKKLNLTVLPVKIAHGLTEAQAKAYRLMDNRSHDETDWNSEFLSAELMELRDTFAFNLDLTGFSSRELVDLLDASANGKGDSILSRVSITIADPSHAVEHGDIFKLGETHTLVVDSVIEAWHKWTPYLVPGALFCPFPSPFVALSEKAKEHALVLVQPDTYVAGHILDRYIEINGTSSVRREKHD